MTPAAADSAPPHAAVPSILNLRDFSDRLSPMLVKELRQGLKSHVFTWGLMAMQISLIIMAILSMEGSNVRDIHTFFWWSVAGPVCVLLPMRVANALRDETSGNTLDTLLLTQLSAWRITLGKWLATCALQALVAVTALPYLILRYFAGGVNTPLELAWLGLFVLFGMVVTSIMLGLSWFPYFLVRAVIMLGILFGAAGACGGVIEEISRGNYALDEIYEGLKWSGIIYFLVMAGYVAFFCLDLGAARLAPMSENRATRRRLMALCVLIICGACCTVRWYQSGGRGLDREIATVLSSMLGMAMMLPAIQALCERPVNLAPVLLPFMKRGIPGRLAGRVLLPGWHTGMIFGFLITSLAAGAALWFWTEYREVARTRYGPADAYLSAREQKMLVTILLAGAGVLGTLVMPVVVWKWTRRMNRWDFWRWILLIVAAGAFHIFVSALSSKSSTQAAYAHYALPSGAFLVDVSSRLQAYDLISAKDSRLWGQAESQREQRLRMERQNLERNLMRESLFYQHTILAAISCVLWIGLALWMAFREMRETNRAWKALA